MVAERLSSLDLSFLLLEGMGSTPMHLGGVLILRPEGAKECEGADHIVAILRERVATVPRLRVRLAPVGFPYGAGTWIDDQEFDAAEHVHHWALPAPAGRAELATLTGELLAAPLDRARPLWEMHVIAGLADGSIALLAKLHHALGDGLRSLGLVLSLFDDPRNPFRHEQASITTDIPASHDGGFASGLVGAVSGLLAPARRVLDPHTTLDELGRHAAQARDAAGIAASILQTLVRPTPSTPLGVTVGSARRFAMLRADVDDVKKIRRAHGGTANDVILTAVAGGLRHWLLERGYSLHSPLRALVPVTRPRQDPLDTSGNRISGYLLDLPINEPNPVVRLKSVREAMIAHKTAGLSRGAGAFPMLADLLPSLVHRLAAPLATPLVGATTSRLFNTVITNVPLPNISLTLGGARLTEIYPVIPLAPGQALGVAVSTYQRTVHIGLHADHATMPDLSEVGEGLAKAFAELVACKPVV